MATALLNHGLGFMTETEHQELIAKKIIVCRSGNGDVDSIICDYPKLMIESRGIIESMDLNGDSIALQGEMAKAQREHKRAWIEHFPRRYETWHEQRFPKNN